MYYDKGTYQLLANFSERPVTFKELSTGIEFEAKPFDVVSADAELNKQFQIVGQACLSDFFSILEIEPICYDDQEQRLSHGWCLDCFDGWDAPWIDFICKSEIENEKVIFTLEASVGPCSSYQDCYGCYGCDGTYICQKCGEL